MACKAKTKPANDANNTPIFQASNVTQHLLAMMNQNHHAASKFMMDDYVQHVPEALRSIIMDNLMHMKFQVILDKDANKTLPQPEASTTQEDDDGDIQDIIDTLQIVGLWCEKHTPIIMHDKSYNELKRLVGMIASLFDITQGPHQCPTVPPPSPCPCPHRDEEDIPMELPAPTRVFSEAASQTPAPSHEASMPPPPAAAAAASIPPAGPRGCASYAGAAAKNLNPAAPPFVHGPPHTPEAQPPAQAQQPALSKHSK
ncbi:hypothetical protein P691DRAFT_768330 [Macrolepiota fuliginosa MF-IS2]|uniref:Uncharacterized protein n=1 Tax=Macrolepiota fuliginosa MF-IS2 TaxID=1400762 RepID=A0A9P5WXD8_9AGAR|nr:hypothetical protein P691DRAFT_768330 [Macrolepiota fuliginosa MF-IS2]